MKRLLTAFQFLTIIPLPKKIDISERDIIESVPYFVVVGIFQGFVAIGVFSISRELFNHDISSFLSLLTLILINGGFHMDGLADTFDALSIKPKGDELEDRLRRLSAMKDSYTGAIGAIALISIFTLKFFVLKEILMENLFALPIITGLSRWAITVTMKIGKEAKKEGLGSLFMGNIKTRHIIFSTTIFLCFFTIFLFFEWNKKTFLIMLPLLFFISLVIVIFWNYLCNRKFGGQTGDTLGAQIELTEAIMLLSVIPLLKV